MNFLAHALLAGDADADRVGGVMGDFIKGPLPAALPPDLADGVALHRAIDSFAERHGAFIRSRQRISTTRRRVAGVLVDLFYDHLLACHWRDFSPVPLAAFSRALYEAVDRHRLSLPPPARPVAERMRDNDWLASYRHVDAVGVAIDRMAVYRLRRANPLGGGIAEFLADPDGFSDDFRRFMPDALAFAAEHRRRRPAPAIAGTDAGRPLPSQGRDSALPSRPA